MSPQSALRGHIGDNGLGRQPRRAGGRGRRRRRHRLRKTLPTGSSHSGNAHTVVFRSGHLFARRRDNQTVFDFAQFPEAEAVKIQSTNELEKAAEREKASRSIFAQHAIKAREIEQDLREMDEALGDPRAVERFVTQALSGIFGAQCDPSKHGYRLHPGNLPAGLKETLGANGQPPMALG